MLVNMRRAAKSWMAKLLLFVLVASFAAWGIGDILSVRSNDSVFSAGDTHVSASTFARELQNRIRAISASTGVQIDLATARQLQFDQIVLKELASDAVLKEEANRLGLSASDKAVVETISSVPAFQGAHGGFNRAMYNLALRNIGQQPEIFEENLRQELAFEQIVDAVGAGLPTTQKSAQMLVSAEQEKRAFDYILLRASDTPTAAPPAEGILQAYYEDNIQRYYAPEYRNFSYILVDPSELADPSAVNEGELAALYEDRRAYYTTEERRQINRIYFPTREEAQSAKSNYESGTDFAEIASSKNLTEDDYNLGEVEKGDLPAEIDEVVFALEQEGIAGPLQTAFGWALFEVANISKETSKPFAAVKEELAKELSMDVALDQLVTLIGEIEESLAAGLSFSEIADNHGVKFGDSGLIDAQALDTNGLTAATPLTEEMIQRGFALTEGEEMSFEEAMNGVNYILALEDIRPTTPRPFAEIRARVLADWQATEQRKKTFALAEEIAEQVRTGASLAEIAATGKLTYISTTPLLHEQIPEEFSENLEQRLFAASVNDIQISEPDAEIVLIVAIKEIIPADLASEELQKEISARAERIRNRRSQELIEQFTREMVSVHDGRFYPQPIEQVLGALQ